MLINIIGQLESVWELKLRTPEFGVDYQADCMLKKAQQASISAGCFLNTSLLSEKAHKLDLHLEKIHKFLLT